MLKYLKNLNVLLVEDERKIQQSLKEIFEYFFKNVYVANDGLEALKVLEGKAIHTVFTDYEMPKLNGLELVQEIRTFDKKILITMISNHDDKEKLQACIPIGLSGYLFKPLTYDKMKKYLHTLVYELLNNGGLTYIFSKTHQLDIHKRVLIEDQTTHQLTKLEFSFLQAMIYHEGRIATFDQIYEYLFEFDITSVSIKNIVYRLKTKYNLTCIKNIKETGYILINED